MVGMHEGSFDFVFTVSDAVTEGGLNSSWLEPMVWVGKPEAIGEMSKPLRLLAFAEGCPYRALMKDELTRADMPYEVIYTSQCLPTLRAALNSGFGITVLPERAVQDRDLILKGNSRLPKLPELRGAIYLAGRMASPDAGPLATRFAQMVNTSYLRVA
jgi:DNA-binding transcriptional LysR family regulator